MLPTSILSVWLTFNLFRYHDVPGTFNQQYFLIKLSHNFFPACSEFGVTTFTLKGKKIFAQTYHFQNQGGSFSVKKGMCM